MNRISKIKNYYNWGGRFLNDSFHLNAKNLNEKEIEKRPFRYDIINFLLDTLQKETTYLEIGVRNPDDNFNLITANKKYSVDPGLEFEANPVDFPFTSDEFFEKLRLGHILEPSFKFDVIFIDGLHTAEQVDRDIENALHFVHDDGFVVLHDCNPLTEFHARETHSYTISPAGQQWNGTTWKGFVKWRQNPSLFSCTVDTDWGVGIISKSKNIGLPCEITNEFFEFKKFDENRVAFLNLISFEELKNLF